MENRRRSQSPIVNAACYRDGQVGTDCRSGLSSEPDFAERVATESRTSDGALRVPSECEMARVLTPDRVRECPQCGKPEVVKDDGYSNLATVSGLCSLCLYVAVREVLKVKC